MTLNTETFGLIVGIIFVFLYNSISEKLQTNDNTVEMIQYNTGIQLLLIGFVFYCSTKFDNKILSLLLLVGFMSMMQNMHNAETDSILKKTYMLKRTEKFIC